MSKSELEHLISEIMIALAAGTTASDARFNLREVLSPLMQQLNKEREENKRLNQELIHSNVMLNPVNVALQTASERRNEGLTLLEQALQACYACYGEDIELVHELRAFIVRERGEQ